jgi:hypothetical protein
MENLEIVVNIWFIVDIETELCYNWLIKPYCISGTDREKTKILKILAETDYQTVHRNEFEKRFKAVSNNMTAEGKIPHEFINRILDTNLDYFLSILEKNLPLEFNFSGNFIDPPSASKSKLSENPLFVSTLLMENEFGEMKPYTTIENKAWYESEKQRIEFDRQSRNN